MIWSTACRNAPDETLGCARCSPPQTQTEARSNRRDAIINEFRRFFGAGPLPHRLLSLGGRCVAAPPSCKGRPGSGPCVAHWAENDAYPYLAPSQNETIHDHIWCEIHTAWNVEFHPRTRPHASERAKNAASRVLLL